MHASALHNHNVYPNLQRHQLNMKNPINYVQWHVFLLLSKRTGKKANNAMLVFETFPIIICRNTLSRYTYRCPVRITFALNCIPEKSRKLRVREKRVRETKIRSCWSIVFVIGNHADVSQLPANWLTFPAILPLRGSVENSNNNREQKKMHCNQSKFIFDS